MNPSILIIPPCCFPKHLNLIFAEADSTLKTTDLYETDIYLEPDVFLHDLLPQLVYELPHTTLHLRLRTIPDDLNRTLVHLSSRPHIPVGAPSTTLIASIDMKQLRKKSAPETLILTNDIAPRRSFPVSITLQGELSTPLTPKMRTVHLKVERS